LIRTQIMLEEEQHKFLLEEARSKGISLSEAIRRLIAEKQRSISLTQSKGGLEMAQKAIAVPADYLHHERQAYRLVWRSCPGYFTDKTTFRITCFPSNSKMAS